MKRVIALALGMMSLGAPGRWVSAQSPAELDLQVYAGLTITGAVGAVYAVEYVTDLAQTNTVGAWRCLEYVQLPASPHLWVDKSAPATTRRFYRAVLTVGAPNLVFIPPGTFRMGGPTNEVDRWEDEGPQTTVTISRGFWMGKHEVTQREFESVMGRNPSLFVGDPDRPVEQVSWGDATNYCGLLTTRERAAGTIATHCAYRLPTEAEWEYACRALTTTRFSYGDDPSYGELVHYAWYGDFAGESPHPVGSLRPNPWDLYDVHGNVGEWCQDYYGAYPGGTVIDPRGPQTGSYHVVRGGSWGADGRSCRSAFRNALFPDFGGNVIGFRVVLAPGEP